MHHFAITPGVTCKLTWIAHVCFAAEQEIIAGITELVERTFGPRPTTADLADETPLAQDEELSG